LSSGKSFTNHYKSIPKLYNIAHLLSINKAPFLFREVLFFMMAFATVAIADVMASVSTLSDSRPHGSGKLADSKLSSLLLLLLDDFIVL